MNGTTSRLWIAAILAGFALAPAAAQSLDKDVSYGPDGANKIDVYQPPGKRDLPILIFIPGGGFIGGGKRPYENIGVYFANHDMLVINADYRVAPQHPWPAGAEDVGKVVAWAKANAERYGGDTRRIFLMGHSAGATHVASYLFDPKLHPQDGAGVAAAILISGRYRVTPEDRSRPNVMEYFGRDASQYPARSPITYVDESKVPLFLAVAENDWTFLALSTFELAAQICRRDDRCPRFFWVKGHDHVSEIEGFTAKDDEFGRQILDFVGSMQ